MSLTAFMFSWSNVLRTIYIAAAFLALMAWRGNGVDPVAVALVALLTFFILNPLLEAAVAWVRRGKE
ncbi:hypothetical protein N9H93_01040 [Rhizobiaceae bacterium]|nr:hypothetical protein [Rhizobiaceae bacterium]